jgi:hypothetical protein
MKKEAASAKSHALLLSQGAVPWEVERWAHAVKVDLFNIFDLIAIFPLEPKRGILAVQTTSASNFSTRRKKIEASPYAAIWLLSGGKIELHGWDGRKCRIARAQMKAPAILGKPLVEMVEEI